MRRRNALQRVRILVQRVRIGAWTAFVACAAVTTATAAEVAQHIEGLRPEPDLPLPSAARIVTAAIVTIAAAVGVLLLAQRFLPKLIPRSDLRSNAIRVLGRTTLTRTLRVHLVEVETSHVLIVEGRGGVDLTVLPRSGEDPSRGEAA